jgi:hypothetical protein
VRGSSGILLQSDMVKDIANTDPLVIYKTALKENYAVLKLADETL